MPKVSVLMPVYNENQEYLINATESVLNQTYRDFEFIIIDDGSDSYIQETISSFKDKRIKYTRLSQNSKICAALNYGLSAAKGEYIAIMHSDDFSVRTRLEHEVQILDEKPNTGLVNSYSLVRQMNKCKVGMPFVDCMKEKLFLTFIGNNLIHPNVMLRKKVLDEHSITYRPKFVYAEDYRMWVDLIPYCDFYTIPEILTVYNMDINPSRQNKSYMHKCAKAILIENYIRELKLPFEEYGFLIESTTFLTSASISSQNSKHKAVSTSSQLMSLSPLV